MKSEITKETSMTEKSFWKSVQILTTKTHVVNKRVWGSKVLYESNCKPVSTQVCLPEQCIKLQSIEDAECYTGYVRKVLHLQQCDKTDSDILIHVIFSELLPRNYCDSHAVQLICLLKDKAQVTFYDVTPENDTQSLCPTFSYTFQLTGSQVVLKANCDCNSKSFKWLSETVLPQFIKWGQECTHENATPHICNESLALVSTDKYYQRYNDLKIKYGKEMVKVKSMPLTVEEFPPAEAILARPPAFHYQIIVLSPDTYICQISAQSETRKWIKFNLQDLITDSGTDIWPECTDPTKFVYEDVAIATYLLLLWEEERALCGVDKLQSFVDLGCGNGLLVYILAKEGHRGVGIDVRKRQIWDMFGSDIKLEERTITPSDVHLFPDTDWIIGNHSDELTPWIPVIAARSSYKCNFFLLPCCAYNFDGTKYQRKNSSKSQYTEYLEYINQLCEDVGFKTDTDRLKIPSTKRICLVGRGRTYDEKVFEDQCSHIQTIINGTDRDSDNVWIDEFKSRDPVERVKNCTQIDKSVIQLIVRHITDYLLEGCISSVSWSPGKTADINELVQVIPQDQLKALKSECGGLQTLLKNNHHIFKVQSGKVQLRYPKTIEEVERDSQYKKNKSKSINIRVQCKPCWFYNQHPQGCPLSDNKCSFLHTKS